MKTHKTGATSVQNILFRYGDTHNLTFVLPKVANYFGHPQFFDRRMLHSQPTFSQYNILAHHARYNYNEMKSIMPADTIFVTILRDPVLVIESVFSYYNFKRAYKENSTIEFLEKFFSSSPNTSTYHSLFHKRVLGKYGNNQMSFDLGLDPEHFDNLETINKFIKTIDSQFHLVMIADRMEESLIHLQHLLCWTRDDMITFQHNVRNVDVSRNIPSTLQEKIRFFNKADELLYRHFSDKLARHTEAFGQNEMEKQIISLQRATKLVYDSCVKEEVPMRDAESSKLVWYSPRVLGYELKDNADKICQDLTISELLYTELLKKKQGLPNSLSEASTNSRNVKPETSDGSYIEEGDS
jgi:hypothetical protein